MKSPNLLLTLLLIASGSACFRPDLTCVTCKLKCPSGLTCVEGYCVEEAAQVPICVDLWAKQPRPEPTADGATGPDVGPPADGPLATDAEPASDTGNGLVPDGAANYTCQDKCCIGNECLAFTPRMQAGLLLWLDRTTLGAPGSRLVRWHDRSPNQTDVVAVNADSLPRVQVDEVGPIAEIDEERMVLTTERPLQRRFGFDDFVVYVVGRCDARSRVGSLFGKNQTSRPFSGVTLYCNHDGAGALPGPLTSNRAAARIRHEDLLPSTSFGGWAVSSDTYQTDTLHLVGARRVGKTRFQLRVDGKVQSEVNIPDAVNLDDDRRAAIGAQVDDRPFPTTAFDGGIAAVVVVSGTLSDQEVADLEAFLLKTTAGL